MATDTEISALPVAAALDGTEVVPLDQGGVTSRTTSQAIANLIGTGATGPAGADGATGPMGNIQFTGHGAPGTIIGSSPGNSYVDWDSGIIYTLS